MTVAACRSAHVARGTAVLLALVGASALSARRVSAQVLRLGTPTPAAPTALARESADSVGFAATDASGGLYLLHRRSSRLAYLAPSANGARYTTAATLAPLEVADPRTLVVRGPGRIGILDDRAGAINVVVRQGATFRAADTLRLGTLVRVSGLCAIGDRTFAAGIDPKASGGGTLLHVLGADGARAGDFGTPLGEQPFARDAYSEGRLVCSPERQQVIFTSRYFPEMRAYSAAGMLAWSRQIRPFAAPFAPMQVVSPRPGSVRYVLPRDSVYHEVVSTFPVDRETVAVQVAERQGYDGRRPPRRMTTLFYRTTDGTELGAQAGLPLVLAATRTHLVSLAPGDASAVLLTPFTRLGR